MVHLIKAARGNINSRHGEQIGRGFPHVGIDIGWGGGLELYAPAAGWLTWSEVDSYGNLARITHADGSYSRIAHADSYIGTNGRNVTQGEHIGTMGRTGGPWGTSGWFVHCHQEYWVDGVAVDPLDYMGSTPASSTITPITPTASGDDDMRQIKNVKTGETYLVGNQMLHHLPDANYTGPATTLYGAVVELDETRFHAITDALGIPWAEIPKVGPGAGWSSTQGLHKRPW